MNLDLSVPGSPHIVTRHASLFLPDQIKKHSRFKQFRIRTVYIE